MAKSLSNALRILSGKDFKIYIGLAEGDDARLDWITHRIENENYKESDVEKMMREMHEEREKNDDENN